MPQLSDSEDEAIRNQLRNHEDEFVNDFEAMLAKKKEEAGRHRRRKNNVDIINDNEEHIAIIVRKVRFSDYDRVMLLLSVIRYN